MANFVETRRIRWELGLKISAIVASLPPHTRWLSFEFIEVSKTAISAFADLDGVDAARQILTKRKRVTENH